MEFEKAMSMVGDAYERAFTNILCHPNVYENKGMTRIYENRIDACLAIMQGVADLKKKLEDAEKKLVWTNLQLVQFFSIQKIMKR